jgi:1,2-diacylglycerol 3-alpha-glucosyltransferase
MRIALVVPTAGPYWQARGRALAARPDVGALLIAVTRKERTYRWEAETTEWVVMASGLYEDLDWRAAAKAVIAELERFGPDAVLTMGYSDPLMGRVAWWAKRRRVVSVTAWQSTRADRARSWWKELAKRWLARVLFDAAFAGGPWNRQYAIELGFPPERVVTGYAVVDNEAFARRAAAARDQQGRAQFFLYVGRFAPEKNLRRLVEAYGRHRQAGGSWELVLVGDGAERDALERMIDEDGIAGVHVRPWATLDELAGWYGLASCFVLPSLSEPWGLVVNEAMATGLPVLVSERCGCVPELVSEGENGFAFDPLDVAKLTALLGRIEGMDAPTREAMGRESEEIVGRYTPETWAERLVGLMGGVRRTAKADGKGA